MKIDGPSSLYRFSGLSKRGLVSGAGEWWITERVYVALYDQARSLASGNNDRSVSSEFIRLYRERLAVSLDWNDLLHFYRMNIPEGAYVIGVAGPTAPQPKVSFGEQRRSGRPTTDVYTGGAHQVLLTYPPAVWKIREDWIKSISF